MQARIEHGTEYDFVTFMRTSHGELMALAKRLRAAVVGEDRNEMHASWLAFESQLLAHMEAEERYVLPAFARAVPDEALALVRDHGTIRERLLELGVTLELHHLRLERFDEFLGKLAAHAQREETLLYRWATTMLERKLAHAARRHVELGVRVMRQRPS
jgi:hypothetical protein